MADGSKPLAQAQGQLVHKRQPSKNVVFYDLRTDPASNVGVELKVLVDVFGTVEDIRMLRQRVKLGDVVAASGYVLNDHTLEVTHMAVVSSWADACPGKQFVAIPPVMDKAAIFAGQLKESLEEEDLQQQQQQQQQQVLDPSQGGSYRHRQQLAAQQTAPGFGTCSTGSSHSAASAELQSAALEARAAPHSAQAIALPQPTRRSSASEVAGHILAESAEAQQQQGPLPTGDVGNASTAVRLNHEASYVRHACKAGDPMLQQCRQSEQEQRLRQQEHHERQAQQQEQQQQQQQQQQQEVCKFWVNCGTCGRGSACPFLHPELGAGAVRSSWLVKRKARRQAAAEELGYAQPEGAALKKQRAAVFARWLVETYGRQFLNSGSGVLDVAGGQGGLTFELQVSFGVRSTLVDPRPFRLTPEQQQQLLQRTCGAPAPSAASNGTNSGGGPATTDLLAAGTSTDNGATAGGADDPMFAPLFAGAQPETTAGGACDPMFGPLLEAFLAEAAAGTGEVCLAAAVPLHAASQARTSGAIAGHAGQAQAEQHLPGSFLQIQEMFEPRLWQEGQWAHHIRSCSLVVGMHPDQATEPMLDFALETGKCMAVLPCCVFRTHFPHRRVLGAGGEPEPVSTYRQLVQYLLERSGGREEVLGFQGANRLVYTMPKDAGRAGS